MAGRRLIDAAKLFNASRSIANKHISLRSQQLDVWNRTSALAKAVKSQTERVTLTAEAAIALSKRFGDDLPSYAQKAAEQYAGTRQDNTYRGEAYRGASRTHDSIPRKETVEGERPYEDTKEGLEQDHHYDRSGRNTQVDPVPKGELHVRQEEAKRRPLPDGTIPTVGVDDFKGKDTTSDRLEPEMSEQPLAAEHRNDGAKEEEGLKPAASAASTIPTPKRPTGDAESGQVPEGINTDVFRTKRVAKMLGANPYARKENVNSKANSAALYDRSNTAAGHERETVHSRIAEQTKPVTSDASVQTRPSSTEKEMHDFASQLATGTESIRPPATEVRPILHLRKPRDMLIY
jgi:aarF domain-containing kinase